MPMVLSEAEAEAQLAALRSQRESLDRAIADLSLYLELGRRLTTGPVPPGESARAATPSALAPQPGSRPPPDRAGRADTPDGDPLGRTRRADREPLAEPWSSVRQGPEAIRSADGTRPAPAAPAETDRDGVEPNPMEGALSEGVLARRYGRALIEAALAALEEAGRPLHAGEIFSVLAARGFSLPGHDPVAALNTRLWKRSGPGGLLKRMGDAVYALAEPEDEGRADPMSG